MRPQVRVRRFRLRRGRRKRRPMPLQFHELADYNARVSKGVVHSPEYVARMALLQREFDEWSPSAHAR